jgi:hypothetical protein
MSPEQTLQDLERRIQDHNQRAAQAAAQRQLLNEQRNTVIGELRALGITEISQLPQEVTRLEQEITGSLQGIQAQLDGVAK